VPRPREDVLALKDAAGRVSRLFAEMGFAPELSATDTGRQLELHACPFRAVAREYPEVVCSIHVGLLRGSLARLGVRAEISLQPFVGPELCVAQLGLRRGPQGSATDPPRP
jgi:predicted ArsR family transcriptional regulator